jgi:hypothetical protein
LAARVAGFNASAGVADIINISHVEGHKYAEQRMDHAWRHLVLQSIRMQRRSGLTTADVFCEYLVLDFHIQVLDSCTGLDCVVLHAAIMPQPSVCRAPHWVDGAALY